jgi:hypothetical protein
MVPTPVSKTRVLTFGPGTPADAYEGFKSAGLKPEIVDQGDRVKVQYWDEGTSGWTGNWLMGYWLTRTGTAVTYFRTQAGWRLKTGAAFAVGLSANPALAVES